MKLSQREPDSEGQKLLLDILVSNVKADVTDRKWDTQGSVSIGDVAIMDYIMTGIVADFLSVFCKHVNLSLLQTLKESQHTS